MRSQGRDGMAIGAETRKDHDRVAVSTGPRSRRAELLGEQLDAGPPELGTEKREGRTRNRQGD